MASQREIRRRIGSVKNIRQIKYLMKILLDKDQRRLL